LLLATLYYTFRFTNRELDPQLIRGLALIFAGLMMVLGLLPCS